MTAEQPFAAPSLYPSPSEALLKLQYVGKQIKDVQAPAAIIDAAVVRRNCKLMLETCAKLDVGFRAHVKTHKTTELSQLQVGKGSKSIKLVASTVAEIENLTPWLLESIKDGKTVSVAYGVPVVPSALPRLAKVARLLGNGAVSLFVDHPAQIQLLDQMDDGAWPGKIPLWMNIDVGYHREGVSKDSKQLLDAASAFAASNRVVLAGVYAHYGLSYSVSSPDEALKYMSTELSGLAEGAAAFLKNIPSITTKVVLSLGATPTATSIQNLLEDTEGGNEYRTMIEKCKQSFQVEFHAGVYPVMDMQQLATRARPQHSISSAADTLLSFKDLGLRILAEVASVYTDRGDQPEALIAAGSIVLGRDPCKSYSGWGVVTPWPQQDGQHYDPEGSKTGWIVGRIAQEHGILTWEGPQEHLRTISFGEKVLIWPNHACMAGASFGWYLIVDSEKPEPERIEDVWIRWRGW